MQRALVRSAARLRGARAAAPVPWPAVRRLHPGEHDLDLERMSGDGPVVRPRRIILVRHGESEGNRDPRAYVTTPDWKIRLTRRGHADALEAGLKVKEIVGDCPVYIYTSPYLRTKQTLSGIVSCLDTNEIVGVREEPRLTEQQFGNFQNVRLVQGAREERKRFGRFYYRFPQGESGLDVYNRVTSFIATLFRDFSNDVIARDDLNVIIVTHGLTMRLFLMRWFHYTIGDFEESFNPPNGGLVVMERQVFEDGRTLYSLDEGRQMINYPKQQRVGSLWKLMTELRDLELEVQEERLHDRDAQLRLSPSAREEGVDAPDAPEDDQFDPRNPLEDPSKRDG